MGNRLLIATTVPVTLRAFLLPYARHFRSKGWRVDAVTGETPPEDVVGAFDRVHVVRWSRSPLDPRNLIGTPTALRELVRTGQYDIVHVHTPVAGFVMRYALRTAARSHRPVVVYTAHGFHFHPRASFIRNRAFESLERVGGRWTDHLIVINREDEAAALRLRIVSPERLSYMPGIGVDLDEYAPRPDADRCALREELGVGNRPLVLMVGEFIARKRHADLLKAFSHVLRSSPAPDATLLLAGKGPLEEAMRALSKKLHIEGRVRFLGFRRDVPDLMRLASALVLPSDQEGLPRCVLEAMAIGTPVIASNIRGNNELLARGCGRLFEPGDVADLARCLTAHFHDLSTSMRMAASARQRVTEFSIHSVIDLHEALYARMMSGTTDASSPSLL